MSSPFGLHIILKPYSSQPDTSQTNLTPLGVSKKANEEKFNVKYFRYLTFVLGTLIAHLVEKKLLLSFKSH